MCNEEEAKSIVPPDTQSFSKSNNSIEVSESTNDNQSTTNNDKED